MRIGQTPAGGAKGPTGTALRGRIQDFSVPAEATATPTDAAAPSDPITLAPLAIPTPPAAPPGTDSAAATAQGLAVLDALSGLQKAALADNEDAARDALTGLADALPRAAEPGLDAVLQAIAQRAAIERARVE